ncbi:MazG family protein [Dermacoccaceae bacterium W4C1]
MGTESPQVTVVVLPERPDGRMSRAGWAVLEASSTVLVTASDAVQPAALVNQGIAVTTVTDPDAAVNALTSVPVPATWVVADPAQAQAALQNAGIPARVVHEPAPTGQRLVEAVTVMDQLRSPGGCPWDAEQTHSSLTTYLLEEAFETVEAIEEQDRENLREELGDVLLQVLFHARIAAEDTTDPFNVDDVADTLIAKLHRRHPHVFAGGGADTAAEVEQAWEVIKAAEKPERDATDLLAGIPADLPIPLVVDKVRARLRRGGRDGEFAVELGQIQAQAQADQREAQQSLVRLLRR